MVKKYHNLDDSLKDIKENKFNFKDEEILMGKNIN